MKLTANDLKKMVEDKENIKIVNSLFEAIAYQETIRDIIRPKQEELMLKFKFKMAEKNLDRRNKRGQKVDEFIVNPDHLYLAEESDWEVFDREMAKFYKKQGLKVKREGNCPLLEAENLTRQIKVEVANKLESFIGISYEQVSRTLDGHKKYFDLILEMFSFEVKKYQNKVA